MLKRKKTLQRKTYLKRGKRPRRLSKKREIQVKEYHDQVKPAYLAAHPVCEVEGCGRKSVEVHHKKGKIGNLINDTRFFLATCRPDHEFIEEHPIWAKEKGYSLNRLS